MFKLFSIISLFFFLFSSYGKPRVTIVNKNETKVQNIKATSLVPSKSRKLRQARKEAELETEDVIIQKIEAERMKDEQKRYDRLFSKKQPTSNRVSSAPVNGPRQQRPDKNISFYNYWFDRAFISFGIGTVRYYGVENLNSLYSPAYFFSFGGYGSGQIIFDINLYYSEHFLNPVTQNVNQTTREGLAQPALSMSIKFSPFEDRIKPYVGLVGSIVARRWYIVQQTGELVGDAYPTKDISVRKWSQSFDTGISTGADIALGIKLGLNINFVYSWNVHTETRDPRPDDGIQIVDKLNSMILSANLRYYF